MQLESKKQLLSRVGKVCKHHNELSRISGADFNIFKITKIAFDEVKHSAFLAELLSPNGSHGQGDTFLRLFARKFEVINFNTESAITKVESYVGQVTEDSGGRIDILIDDRRGNHIIIENKIYAGDQPNQLIRYYNFKKQNLFYLTLNGVEASEKSTTNNKQSIKLKAKEDYRPIAYKSDIVEWLELCQKEAVAMPLLREGIAHYINLIKYLTGETANKAMQKEIVDLITESPVNLANAKEIAQNYAEAPKKIMNNFFKSLKHALEDAGVTLLENDKTVSENRVENFFRKKDRYFGFWSCIYKKGDLSIHWGFEISDDVYFGFTLEKNGGGGISNKPEFDEYQKITKSCDMNYRNTAWWLGVQETVPRLDFRAFNSEDIFKLADKSFLERTVENIAAKAASDIQFVKERLEAASSSDNLKP